MTWCSTWTTESWKSKVQSWRVTDSLQMVPVVLLKLLVHFGWWFLIQRNRSWGRFLSVMLGWLVTCFVCRRVCFLLLNQTLGWTPLTELLILLGQWSFTQSWWIYNWFFYNGQQSKCCPEHRRVRGGGGGGFPPPKRNKKIQCQLNKIKGKFFVVAPLFSKLCFLTPPETFLFSDEVNVVSLSRVGVRVVLG